MAINYAVRIAKKIVRNFLFLVQPKILVSTFFKEILSFQPDLIQCHDWQTLELGVCLKQASGAKLIFDSHELEAHRNPPLPQYKKHWIENYEENLLPKVDLLTTVSPGLSRYLENHYKVHKSALIFNSPFNNDTLSRATLDRWGRRALPGGLRSELNLSDKNFIIVMVGNIAMNRGFETIIAAMKRLPLNVHLACVGNVTEDYLPSFYDKININSLGTRVHHVQPVNPIDVVPFISTADIAVVPTIPLTLSYELSLPNKLFEAAFADLPIVASDTIEVKHIVKKYSLGEVYDAGNVEACYNVLWRLSKAWTGPGSLRKDNTDFRLYFDFRNHLNIFKSII